MGGLLASMVPAICERRVNYVPAFERVHELPWVLETLAHQGCLLANGHESILEQARLVLCRRRRGHVEARIDSWLNLTAGVLRLIALGQAGEVASLVRAGH